MLEENLGNKRYKVESDFDDLHGNPSEAVDLDVDLSDSDNPIIQAAVNDSEDYQPPEDDDDKDGGKKDEKFVDDDEEDDDLEELSDDDEGEETDSDEEEGDEEEEEDDADTEDDDERYSKNVQKRIDRERAARQSDNEASNRRIAKLERENKLFREQSKFKEEQAAADSKMRALRKKKKRALEDDDSDSVIDIDDQILDIKADRKAKELELKQLEDSIDDDTDDVSTGTPAAGQRWLEKYPQFHTNKAFQRTVLQADKMVMGRGFDKNLDTYYEEMEKILAPQFPEIIKVAKKTTRKGARKRAAKKRRSAVGGSTKAGTRRKSTRRGVVRLTKQDQEQMEIFGMDPKSPKDVKAWAEAKES